MNALFLVSCAALAACSSGQLINGFYPGFYNGYYPSLYNNFAGLTYNTVAAAPKVAINTVAAAPTYTAAAALPYNFAAPVASLAAPVVSPVQSQYHAQDELGQYSFGYSGGPSARQETRDAFGVVRGSFNYVDADGVVQTQHYVADALGYRVAATNLPVAPDAAAPAALAAPLPVQETPEVAAARAEHLRAYGEAAAAAAAAPDTVVSRKKRDAQFIASAAPLRFSYGFNTLNYGYPFARFASIPTTGLSTTYTGLPTTYTGLPTTYTGLSSAAIIPSASNVVTTYNAAAAAAPRDATLLKVVHNPGHATSYRVD